MEANVSKTKKTSSNNTKENSTKKSKEIDCSNSQSCLKMYDYMIF